MQHFARTVGKGHAMAARENEIAVLVLDGHPQRAGAVQNIQAVFFGDAAHQQPVDILVARIGAPQNKIVALTVIKERVAALATNQSVIAAAPKEDVVATAPVEHIIVETARERIECLATKDHTTVDAVDVNLVAKPVAVAFPDRAGIAHFEIDTRQLSAEVSDK